MIKAQNDNDFVEQFFSKIQSLYSTHQNEISNTFAKCFIENTDIELSKQALLMVIQNNQKFKQIDFDAFDDNYLQDDPSMKDHFDENIFLKNKILYEFQLQYASLLSEKDKNDAQINADEKNILQNIFIDIYQNNQEISEDALSNLTESINNLVNYLAKDENIIEFFKTNACNIDAIQALCNKLYQHLNDNNLDFVYYAKLKDKNALKIIDANGISLFLTDKNIKDIVDIVSQSKKLENNNDEDSNNFLLLKENKEKSSNNEEEKNNQQTCTDVEYCQNIIETFVKNGAELTDLDVGKFIRGNKVNNLLQHKSAFFWLNEQERRNNALLDFINNDADESLDTLNNRLRNIRGGKCSWCCGDW